MPGRERSTTRECVAIIKQLRLKTEVNTISSSDNSNFTTKKFENKSSHALPYLSGDYRVWADQLINDIKNRFRVINTLCLSGRKGANVENSVFEVLMV